MGYRFEIDNKIITYCTDTGVTENIFKLSKNADLLITECSLKIGENNSEWPHLNPEDAVEIALNNDVKKLALTHFDANIYSSMDERMEIQNRLKNKFKNLIITRDNIEIIL